MKFAFYTNAAPEWDFRTVIAKAKGFGFDGVDILGVLNQTGDLAADLFRIEPRTLRGMFEDAGIGIACLSSTLAAAPGHPRCVNDIRRFIDTAQAVGCGMVKVRDVVVGRGRTHAEVASRWAVAMASAADHAAEAGVALVIENAQSFRTASQVWMILEALGDPAVGACWDPLSAALAGETPIISVPVLNSRMRLVQVRDALIDGGTSSLCVIGRGSVLLPELFRRLRGVGYDGWVSVHWDRALFPTLAAADAVLPEALAKLKEWTKPQALPPKPKAAAKAASPAKAVAP